MKVVAFERSVQGTGASRRLRNSGKSPGIIYGGAADPKMIELDHNALWHALKKEAFHFRRSWTWKSAGKSEKALLRAFQMHPFKPLVSARRFPARVGQRQDPRQGALHFMNQETAPGVKLGHGLVNHIVNDLEVSCLPADLPEFIEVDVGTMELGQTLHLADLKLPKGVTVVTHGDDNPAIASISLPAGAASAAEGTEGEGEGETPAA
ncbi:50S ribosomal protein L25/general stress protein Ctc [Cupriavidus basilensis]